MKKVLFVSPFFYPEQISTGKWNTYVARGISKHADLTVFCLHPFYPEWKISLTSEQLPGINIVRRGRFLWFPGNSLLRRFILEFYFGCASFWYLLFRRKSFDELIFIFPPSLMAYLCALIFRKRIVGVIHDLQGVYAKRSLIGSIIGRAISFVEKRAFRKCERLVFLSNEMKQETLASYKLDPSSCTVAYPFVTINEFQNSGQLDNIFSSNRTRIVYSGALGQKQNPPRLVAFLFQLVNDYEDVEAHVFSRGAEFERRKTEHSGNERLFFHDLVDEEHLPELLLRSDVQVIAQAEGTSSGSLPSKLPNILAAGTKVFLITDEDSELHQLLKDVEGVHVSTTWNQDQLLQSMKNLIDTDVGDASSRDHLMELFSIASTVKLISE